MSGWQDRVELVQVSIEYVSVDIGFCVPRYGIISCPESSATQFQARNPYIAEKGPVTAKAQEH